MMNKSFILLFIFYGLLPSPSQLFAQQINSEIPHSATASTSDTTRIVEIIQSNKLRIKKPNDTTDLTILVGDVRLKQGKTLFYTDSCVIDNRKKIFEAFGRVHISDSDTTDIYSDYLRYQSEIKKAYFNGNVKLTDGHGTLTTPDLDYDMNTKVGTYTKGGKVVNKKTVLTSQEGYYYADLKDVYFKKNVILKDPAYDLTTDSLLYSTAYETVRFITKTKIIDSNKRKITTSDGYYDLKQGKAEFGKRPVVEDGKTTIIGNRIAFDDSTGIAQAEGNAIVVDTTNGTTIIADEIFRNRKTEAILATKKPLMIIKQDADSIYISADTLFSARLTDLLKHKKSFKDSITKSDSSGISKIPVGLDSVLSKDSLPVQNLAKIDSLKNIIPDQVITDTSSRIITAIQNDTLQLKETAINKRVTGKKTNRKNKVIAIAEAEKDSTAGKKTHTDIAMPELKENDSTNRYFEAYRNVRIFSDSMQAVCDSMFYSFRDSTFRLFTNPIIWSKESQITGDTIYLLTKNKKADRMKVWYNSLLVNHLDKEAFNQVKSSRMDAYFLNGDIDSVRARGSAECIYYLQDKDSAYTGINQSQSDIMDVYFRDKEIYRVVFRSSVKGTLWPIRQKSPEEMRLQNFKWLEARRPKTKYELFE